MFEEKSNAKITRTGQGATYSNLPAANLRSWLDYLAATGRLTVTKPGIDLRYQLAAVAKSLDGSKAAVFPRPGGQGMPIVAGILSHRRWIADAIGADERSLSSTFQRAVRNPVRCVETVNAPVYEIVRGDVDLTSLPVPTHNEHDSGPYISAGVIIMRHPVTGTQNVSIVRCQVSGKNRIGALIATRDAMLYRRAAEEDGKPLEIAIVIGADPLVLLASQVNAPFGQDELEIAGALRGAPLAVVKCQTHDVRVPADAELVLEGRVLPQVREPEGPFGEFQQLYGPRGDRDVIEIDLIAHRRDPIFHTIVSGCQEHLLLGSVPREAVVLARLQALFPTVRNVHLSRGGTGRFHLYIQVDKRNEGEPKNIMMAGLCLHFDFKKVVVVDTDVDIFDECQVEWALATRFQADKDLVVVAGAECSRLDPSARDGIGAKMAMDATRPIGADSLSFVRIRIPGEDSIDLNAIANAIPAEQWRTAFFVEQS
jgi:2,5-furandicarboxylate decarboxylase 1